MVTRFRFPSSRRPRAAAMLARDPEVVSTVITHRLPPADAVEAYRVAADKTSGAVRVVLQP